jgi:hypothetical protein
MFPPKWDSRIRVSGLLDDLNCTFRTLHLACSADETVLNVYGNRLSAFHFVNTDRTSVNTGFASSAFVKIDFDFNH